MMKDVEFEAFVKLFDDDEDRARSWLASNVDETNREIAERGMVTRSDDEAPVEDAEQAETKAETEESVERDVELDDEALEAVVRAVAESEGVKALVSPVQDELGALQESVEKLTRALESIQGSLESVDGRVADLERDDDEKRREWQADLPRREKVRVSYRPRKAKANGNDQEEASPEQRAAAIEWPE